MIFQIIIAIILVHINTCTDTIPVQREWFYRIAFGSCVKFYRNHSPFMFEHIADQNADVFMWLGDVAYTDDQVLPGYFTPDPDEFSVREKFHNTKSDPYYQTLMKKMPIIGSWDDHDYGLNNGNMHMPYKDRNQQIFLDFLDVPQDSPRRTRKGLYNSYYMGQGKITKIIQTDTRYFRNPDTGDVLGDEQWKWLENELNDKRTYLYVITSGTQVLPDDRFGAEPWYSESRERLFALIKKYRVSVLFVSGDIHMAEFLTHPCSQNKVGYDLQEVTSSGITMDFEHLFPSAQELTKVAFSDTFSTKEDRYYQQNYGLLDIMLNKTDVASSTVTVLIFGKESIITHVMAKSFRFRDLMPKNSTDFKDESQCIVNTQSSKQRMFQTIIQNIKRELFVEINYNLMWTLAIYFFYIVIVFKVLIYLFKIVTGLYKVKEPQQTKVEQVKKEKKQN